MWNKNRKWFSSRLDHIIPGPHSPFCVMDVIILSYGKGELQETTQNCIDSLIESDPLVNFNVVVVESYDELDGYQYSNTIGTFPPPEITTIYPKEEFGYNKFLNIGLKHCKGDFVAYCNNDLIFHKEWASNIMAEMLKNNLLSACPKEPALHPDHNEGIRYGYTIRNFVDRSYGYGEMMGFCIVNQYKKLAKLDKEFKKWDERFNFSFADVDYARTLMEKKIKHGLVASSEVTHLGERELTMDNPVGKTGTTFNNSKDPTKKDKIDKLINEGQYIFEKKWGSIYFGITNDEVSKGVDDIINSFS